MSVSLVRQRVARGLRLPVGRARWSARIGSAVNHDRGAASLEYTGAVLVAGVVVAVVLASFTLQSIGVGQQVAFGVCKLVTIGGDCGTPGGPAGPQSKRAQPSDPCVLSSNSVSNNREVAVVVVKAKNGRSFEVAQLSDGTYRVTRADTSGIGVEAGIGAGVSLTVNDNKYGGYVGADAGAGLQFRSGQVYYAADTAELNKLINEEAEDSVEDGIFGDGPARAIWEGGQDIAGSITGNDDYDFGEPDEVFAEGGVVVNASAEATSLANSTAVKLAESEGLGVKTTKSGKTTLYLKTSVEGAANLQMLGIDTEGLDFSGGGAEGKLELLTSVTFDSSGNLIEVGTESTGRGQSKGVVASLFNGKLDPSLTNTASGVTDYQAKLPIKTDQDRDTALAFLAASGVSQLGGPQAQLVTAVPGISAMANFRSAAAERGTITQQDLTIDTNTPFALKAAGKLEVELGVDADVSTSQLASTGGKYWDGAEWQDWTACSA